MIPLLRKPDSRLQARPVVPVTRSRIFHIAWPIILSNLSTPLLGLVDTAVIGNLGDPALLGAIAVGGMIFSFLYWGFGFLRMGTTGLVAQAAGAGDDVEVKASLYRPFLIGTMIGLVLLALQTPLAALTFSLIDGSAAVEAAALTYFEIRLYGAPISLAYLAIMGFLLGRQRTRTLLFIQLILNGSNIVLDILFVVVFGWGVAGVAAATVIAEILAMIAGLAVVAGLLRAEGTGFAIPWARLADRTSLVRMFTVNRDIMIRTLCLIFTFAWFTNQGAKAGDVVLAANAILMQFVGFSAFFLDGYALAAETLVGNAVGARSTQQLRRVTRLSAEIAFGTAVVISSCIFFVGIPVIGVLTNVVEVRASAADYLLWAIAAPVISVWCYLLDGIFIGATRSVEMRNAMIGSLAIFLLAWYLLWTPFGNHGLWAALTINYIARAGFLYLYLPRVYEAADPD